MKTGDKVTVLLHYRSRGKVGGWASHYKDGVIVKVNKKTVVVEIRPDWIEKISRDRIVEPQP